MFYWLSQVLWDMTAAEPSVKRFIPGLTVCIIWLTIHTHMKMRASITIDPELHARAKALARRRRTSVSGLFESYVRSQTLDDASVVDGMIGSAEFKKKAVGSNPLRDRLMAKYLR
jgi:hypothetical protein